MNAILQQYLLFALLITSVAPDKAFAMQRQPTHQVTAPFVSIFYPHNNPKRYTVSQKFYIDSKIDNDEYYQMHQYLYGNTVKLVGNEACGSDGSFGYVSSTDDNQFAKIMVKSEFSTPVIVCAAKAQIFYDDLSPALIIPMGSLLYVQNSSDPDYFKFLDPSGSTMLISRKNVNAVEDLEQLDEHYLRAKIVAQAKKLIGYPYQWGGLCACEGSGFDCAGFVQTVYRSCGKKIERCVNRQFSRSKQVEPSALRAGDLIFFYQSRQSFNKADHVCLYEGDEMIIEASPFTGAVTKVKSEDLLGKKIIDFQNNEPVSFAGATYFISFRSLLN